MISIRLIDFSLPTIFVNRKDIVFAMTTKELLKSKIENIREDYLSVLLRVMNSLESRSGRFKRPSRKDHLLKNEWLDFIEQTYGCLSVNPLQRGEQGNYEIREPMK